MIEAVNIIIKVPFDCQQNQHHLSQIILQIKYSKRNCTSIGMITLLHACFVSFQNTYL